MTGKAANLTLVVAEDDNDDFLLLQRAIESATWSCRVLRAEDGEELLNILAGLKRPGSRLWPLLIFLDLNMPRKDGHEALREIKSDALLRRIPVVVLSNSWSDQDLIFSLEEGASSFVRKPSSFEQLTELVGELKKYWTEIVEWPST